MSEGHVAIPVHGYNVENYEETVGKLREPLEALGYYVEFLNYGYVPKTRDITKYNPDHAKRLAKRVKRWQDKGYTVDVFGHSNGCAIGRIATEEYGMVCNVFVAINPALKKDLNPSSKAKLVQVWSNKGDKAVVLGMWLRWLTGWTRKDRPWGEMGRVGYTGKDKNVVNFYTDKDFTVKAVGHSAVFHEPVSDFYTNAMSLFCRKERSKCITKG